MYTALYILFTGMVGAIVALQQTNQRGAVAIPTPEPGGTVVSATLILEGESEGLSQFNVWATDASALGPIRGDISWRNGDGDRSEVLVEVRYMRVNGRSAWVSGRVTEGSSLHAPGTWLFIRVEDTGDGGRDRFWSGWMDDEQAAADVVKEMREEGEERVVTAGDVALGGGPFISGITEAPR